MGFSIETSVPVFTVFLQGLLSFLSPCVLPLVPLYIGYLAGGTKETGPDGTLRYKKLYVFRNTLFFIIGISFAFFLLGFGFTALGRFFSEYRNWFARLGGILILLFGLFQLGVFGTSFFQKEHRILFHLERFSMNPLVALVFGFTFSFAWTPCVGPALASVLLMAGSASSMVRGYLLIGVYTLGFVLPFLAVGVFTSSLLNFFQKHRNVVKYTVKAGGVLMILMGIMMLTGWMNGITSYLSGFGSGPGTSSTPQPSAAVTAAPSVSPVHSTTPAPEKKTVPAPDFTLTDQAGTSHKLSDYKGKVVFLNFWASWCGPCKKEMPDIQKLYQEWGENQNDLIVLGVANPKTPQYPNNSDGTVQEVTKFLADNGYTYPTVMDITGEIFAQYGIRSFPTTFMVDREGNVFGYVSGTLTRQIMDSIIQQTMEGKAPGQ